MRLQIHAVRCTFIVTPHSGFRSAGPAPRVSIFWPARPAAPTSELYNLAADPSEKENVADAHPDIVARLEKIMSQEHRPSKEFPFKDTLDKGRGG
jgi:hypothetical protein